MINHPNNDDIGFVLIDPPVSAYSSEEDIREWIKRLEQLPDRPEVRTALDEALRWLELGKE